MNDRARRETERQRDRQRDRETESQTDRESDRQTERRTDRKQQQHCPGNQTLKENHQSKKRAIKMPGKHRKTTKR